MYNKLKIIKMFLSTTLLALLLISVFKSCSYAYTIDDFIDFTAQVKLEKSNFNKSTTQIIQYQDSLKRDCANYEFITFICTNANWTQSFQTTELTFRATPIKVNVTTDNVKVQNSYQSSSQWYTGSYYNGSWRIQRSTTNWNNFNSATSFGLIELDNQQIDNWGNNWFNEKYVIKWVMGIEHPNNPNDPLPLVIGEAMTSYSIDTNNITFKLFNTENVSQDFNYQINIEEGENGNIYTIWLLTRGSVISGNYYYLVMYKNDIEIARSENYLITFTNGPTPSGTITNQSGDVTGEIDLTGIETRLDNVQQAIISGDNKILQELESGEQKAEERQTFWQQAYETMFIPSGDKIENNIQQLKEHIGMSGDVSGELLILENIKNNSGDFIIKWDTMQSHFSLNGVQLEKQLKIPSGEINFSRIERENETFQTTMEWVRILLGFSLIVLIIKQTWILILKTLGLSTEVYEEHREEKERLNKAQAKKDNIKRGEVNK